MKAAKRQIILGALILALGAAVYLNWQFTETIPANTTPTSSVGQPETHEIEDENLGIAQLVNNSYIQTTTNESDNNTTVVDDGINDVMAQARIERQTARDDALDILSAVLDNEEMDAEAKKAAVDDSAQIAQNMIMESNAENLIKAKGIDDVVVYINEDTCTTVVKGLEDNMLIVQDIIINQTGLALENIQIIDAK